MSARATVAGHLIRAALVAAVSGALLVTGLVAPASAARVPAAVAKTPTLSYGERGTAVAWVQRRLHVRPASGWFGPRTRAAVKRFQRGHHIQITGVVASRTWIALGVRPAHRAASRQARAFTPASQRAAKVLALAAKQTGKPYRYGASGPRAFDCSGFVSYVYRSVGIALPHSSRMMRAQVRRISASSVRPGDLVFVHKGGRVTHVAIFASRGYWWEASNPSRPVGKHKAWTRSVSYGRV